MPGRYGLAAKVGRESAMSRSRSSVKGRVLGLMAGTALMAAGVLALTSMASQPDTYELSAADPDGDPDGALVARAGSGLSRSDERAPGRVAHILPKIADPFGRTASPRGPAEAGRPDEPAAEATIQPNRPQNPNRKPAATAPLPKKSGAGKRIVFDITEQQVWLVKADGEIARAYRVSGSRHDQLDPGRYEVFSKSEKAISWTLDETMRYMVRFHKGENSNIGFHDIPIYKDSGKKAQTLSELGMPLSDGCIRQDPKDAEALWEFAPVGTTVIVVRT